MSFPWCREPWYRFSMTCTLAILWGPDVNLTALTRGIEHLRPLLEEPLFDELLLCCQETAPFRGLGMTLVTELFPGMGPLAGLHAALAASPKNKQVVALSVSKVLPSLSTLRQLALHPPGPLVVLLRDRTPLAPLPGRYSPRCLKQIRRALLAGRQELPSLIRTLQPVFCTEEKG